LFVSGNLVFEFFENYRNRSKTEGNFNRICSIWIEVICNKLSRINISIRLFYLNAILMEGGNAIASGHASPSEKKIQNAINR